jgi:hypothetical protein
MIARWFSSSRCAQLVAACNEFFARRLDYCSQLFYFALYARELFSRFSDRGEESIGKVRGCAVLSFRPTRAANCFCSPNSSRLIIGYHQLRVGFIKIDDQIWGIAVIGIAHVCHKMRTFFVVEDTLPLSSCPPKTKVDPLQKTGHEMI